mmetsp:Transcript_70707/g.229749  ORF Transcript_70707/g.229749 Transcript_70707/m.229749 type:complete len:329 (-) Transcript_70707:7-993(-)
MSISRARRAMPMDHAAISNRLRVSLTCIGANPEPTVPSKLAAGIRQSSNETSKVNCPPSILMALETVMPGVPVSTKKAVMPPELPSPGSACAITMMWSMVSPRVIQILVPFRSQLSPCLTAFIAIILGSAPAPGSEMPIADTVSPLEYGNMYLSFCSSLHASIIMCKFGESGGKVNGTIVLPSSSSIITSAVLGRFTPSNCSGKSKPHSPNSFAFTFNELASSGDSRKLWPLASRSSSAGSRGMRKSSTKRTARSRIISCSSGCLKLIPAQKPREAGGEAREAADSAGTSAAGSLAAGKRQRRAAALAARGNMAIAATNCELLGMAAG